MSLLQDSGKSSKSNLYAYCADNPIDGTDSDGLAPVPVNDSELNSQMASLFDTINGDNREGVPVSEMWYWFGFHSFMLETDIPNAYGGYNAEADTSFHGSPYSYSYTGSEYPELWGQTLIGNQINYMGVGAAMAARGYSTEYAEWVTEQYYENHYNTNEVPPGVMAAMLAGWDAYALNGGPFFAFPPSSCMDSMPAAFSSNLSLGGQGYDPGSTPEFSF